MKLHKMLLVVPLCLGLSSLAVAATLGDIQVCYYSTIPFGQCQINNAPVDAPVFIFQNTSGTPITNVVFYINGDGYQDSFKVGTIPAGMSVFVTPGLSNDGGSGHTFFQYTGTPLDTSDLGPDGDDVQFWFTGLQGSVPVSSSVFTPGQTAGPSNDGTVSYINFLGGPGNADAPCDNCFGPKVVATLASPVQFVPVMPCRLVDTRNANGEFGGPSLQANSTRSFAIPDNQDCQIPSAAAAYSLNVTVVPHGALGYLTVWPTGESQPYVSTLNSYDGRVKADAAIVPAGTQGAVSFYVSDTTDMILDIDGYFEPPGGSTLAFYPLTPCRVADTRNPVGDLGGPFLTGGKERDFPILEATACKIPNSAQAYSLNFTVVPHGPLGYLTVWPSGLDQPYVSTLNSYGGQVVANAAIVPAGMNGD